MRGDMLNGLFGTETGGNTFVNVILIVVVTYLLSCRANKEKSVISFGVAAGASLLIAALIELKAFFVEIIIIYGFYLIKKRNCYKCIPCYCSDCNKRSRTTDYVQRISLV